VRRVAFGFSVLALCSCAAGAARSAPAASAARAPSAAAERGLVLELAGELPSDADRCVVAHPARLPPERRALFARASQAEPLAWLPELAVSAYASVEHTDRDGPSARVSLLAIGIPQAQARALLDAHAGIALDWSDAPAPCTADACPIKARFTPDGRLRLERGVFPISPAPGVELRCRTLFEKHAQALEINAVRTGPNIDFELNGLPLRTSNVLRPAAEGFHVVHDDLLHSVIEADAALHDETAAGLLLGQAAALGSNVRREQHGAALRTEYDVLWEDLELARDDDLRAQAAEREADARERARPAGDTPAATHESVESELGYRLDLARRVPAGDRDAELLAARALLERALARSPDDEGLGLLLCELLVSELHDPGPVAALAQRFAARPGARPRWVALRRHAAALTGESALADRLVEDGVTVRRNAVPLAREILSRMRQGMTYEAAEQAAVEAAGS
jgi:hypothetical protein